jgi:tetratricopeptide (TPR) repeat protein
VRALRERVGPTTTGPPAGLPELPLALRRTDVAVPYLAAEGAGDHATAAAAAADAAEQAIAAEDWWPADAWAHRALWHFEQAEMTLEATRQARRIGDLRTAAGDPDSARRYYAEAIDEARDIGAEHEQGLAALGLGRALLELGEVTQARRLASASLTLLERSSAPAGELTAARELLGMEVSVGERAEEGN